MRRFLVRALVAIVAGVAVAFIVYQTSVQPGAALVRSVFQSGVQVDPPAGFATIEPTVTEVRVPIHVRRRPGRRDRRVPALGPARRRRRPVVLWIHGGGFLANSAADFRDWGILLAHQGYVVALLDYSLAPETRYPVPVRQGNAALAYLEQHAARYGGDPSRIVLGGDSAGAQIAAQLAAVQTDPALARSMGLTRRPGALRGVVVVFCGLYDMRTVGGTGFPALRTYLRAYTGSRNWTSYPDIDQLSVTQHVTAAYPATFLSVGDADPFAAQAAELAAVLRGGSRCR